MSRHSLAAMLSLMISVACVATAAEKKEGQHKSGTIKSVDAAAKTFVLDLAARPLTFTVNDQTVITLGGKSSTFADAIKPDRKATVTYTRSGDDRLATKVEVEAEAGK